MEEATELRDGTGEPDVATEVDRPCWVEDALEICEMILEEVRFEVRACCRSTAASIVSRTAERKPCQSVDEKRRFRGDEKPRTSHVSHHPVQRLIFHQGLPELSDACVGRALFVVHHDARQRLEDVLRRESAPKRSVRRDHLESVDLFDGGGEQG